MRRAVRALGISALALMPASQACKSAGGATKTHWSAQQQWRSAHFVYHARPGDASVDASVLQYLEANLTLVAQGQLALDPSHIGPIDYYKYTDLADFQSTNRCPGMDVEGCAIDYSDGSIEVHSPIAVDEHELVHAYAYPIGEAPRLLAEGLAVSLSCDWSTEQALASQLFVRANLNATTWSQFYDFSQADKRQYAIAGILTTWLVDQFGMGDVLRVYRALPGGASSADFAASVQAVTGQSMDDLWQAMVAAPTRRPCLNSSACTVLDPTSDPFDRNRQATPVAVGGTFVSEWMQQDGVPPAVRPCSAAGALSTDVAWPSFESGGFSTTLFLPNSAGYVVTSGLRGPPWDGGPGAPTDYTTSPVPSGVVGATCAGLQPVSFQASAGSAQLWPSPNPVVFGVQHFPTAVAGSVQANVADTRNANLTFSVQACSDCVNGALTGCQTLTPSSYYAAVTPSATPLWISVSWNPPIANELLTVSIAY